MTQPSARAHGDAAPSREIFEALVVEAHESGRVTLRRADGAPATMEARCAVHGYAAAAGDRVLCTAAERGTYVTGVLLSAPQLRAGETCARIEDGALVLRAADGAHILRHDPAAGVTHVSSERTVLSIESAERLELRAKEVSVEAERLVKRVGALVTEAEQVATSVDRWELRANRITERARNVFRDVEALLQTRAGTVRTIARAGLSLFANRTSIRSKKDTAIDGERVLLG